MIATTLTKFKEFAKITSTDDDTFISNKLNTVTKIIETYINISLTLKQFAETLSGDDTDELFVLNMPVKKLVSLYISDVAETITDYSIENEYIIISDDGIFPDGNKNILITYKAGIEEIEVTSQNNKLKIEYDGDDYTCEITEGIYLLEDFLGALETEMEDETDGTFTVSYNYNINKIKIEADADIKIYCTSTTSDNNSMHSLLGFSNTADKTGETNYTADNEVLPLPGDIIYCANAILLRIFNDYSKDRFDVNVKGRNNDNIEYNLGEFPRSVERILNNYRKLL